MNFRDQILGAYLRGLAYKMARKTPVWLTISILLIAWIIGGMKL
jgi:hypothetical protein